MPRRDIKSLTVTCEKMRCAPKFPPFLIGLNDETLRFDFLGTFDKKFNEETLIQLFDSFGLAKVAVADLCKKAETEKICSADTVRHLIKESSSFAVDKTQKKHSVYRVAGKSTTTPLENVSLDSILSYEDTKRG